jgi:SAM-dependent methyltransferase
MSLEGFELETSRRDCARALSDAFPDAIRMSAEGTGPAFDIYDPVRALVRDRIVAALLRGKLLEDRGGDDRGADGPPALSYDAIYALVRDAPGGVLEGVGLRNRMPPDDVPMLARGRGAFLDIRNADIFEEICHANGRSLESGSFMDFGCASGRTVRTFLAAFPGARWMGCDPVGKSIAWARENYPEAHFFRNDPRPPLDLSDASLDGVFSKSVWSHFGPNAAIDWIDEMHRVLRPSGFLAFTAQGPHRFLQNVMGPKYDRSLRAKRRRMTDEETARATEELVASGFRFVPDPKHPRLYEYGTSFMSAEFVRSKLLRDRFRLLDVGVARTEAFQDIYFCERI